METTPRFRRVAELPQPVNDPATLARLSSQPGTPPVGESIPLTLAEVGRCGWGHGWVLWGEVEEIGAVGFIWTDSRIWQYFQMTGQFIKDALPEVLDYTFERAMREAEYQATAPENIAAVRSQLRRVK